MTDMVLLVFQQFHIYRTGGWSQSFTLKIFFSCSLGGGGRYFSVPCQGSVNRGFQTLVRDPDEAEV